MFASLALSYDKFTNWSAAGLVHGWRRSAAALASPQPNSRVLDLACGTGELSLHLAPRAKLVVGLDFCGPMLAQARAKTRARGLASKVQLVLANARALPFPDERFDGITVGFGVRNLVDLPRCLAEMARVLRTGGHLAILEIGRAETGWTWPLYRFYFNWLVPGLGRWITRGQASPFQYLTDSVANFISPQEMVKQLEAVGLGQVGCRCRHAGLIAIYDAVKTGGAP